MAGARPVLAWGGEQSRGGNCCDGLGDRAEDLLGRPEGLVHRWQWSERGHIHVAVEEHGTQGAEADEKGHGIRGAVPARQNQGCRCQGYGGFEAEQVPGSYA